MIGPIVTPYLASVIVATLNSDDVKNIDPKVLNVILGNVNLISKTELSEIVKIDQTENLKLHGTYTPSAGTLAKVKFAVYAFCNFTWILDKLLSTLFNILDSSLNVFLLSFNLRKEYVLILIIINY